MKPDVTIGFIVQGGWELLEYRLQGLRKNTLYPYNLFIIDNDTNYQNPAYLNIFKGVKKINVYDQSTPHCANLFIEQTDTPYLVLLESSTYVTKDWLTLLINCLKSRADLGIAGPSTSWAWNEQQVVNRPDWSSSEIESFGQKVKEQYGNEIRYLDQLHSISDFCYAFKREVVERIGYFDEEYDKGPCFEIDYNTRAARAGYKCVWVCGAYVHRFPKSNKAGLQEEMFFEINKHLYQKKFCGLQLGRLHKSFCDHCTGEACEHFAPQSSIKIKVLKQNKVKTPRYSKKPLISCIMPTYNRRLFIPQAIKYFLNQDYPKRELVIVDDGTDKLGDIIPAHEHIKYIYLEHRTSIGSKRNLAIEHSRGEIIAHWDDDDWYGKNRLSYQAQPIISGKAEVCGLETGFFYDICENRFWSCNSNLHAMMYFADIHGGSIVYLREVWEKYSKYPNSSLGEDAAFLRNIAGKAKIVKVPNKNVFIYIRHNKNTWEFLCGKFIYPEAWNNIPKPSFLGKNDLDFYKKALLKV